MGNKKLTIGIIGGMGPMAGIDIQKKIIENTPAQTDQDHFKIIAINDPNIIDRTSCIKNDDFSIVEMIVNNIKFIEQQNPDFVIIACNTAHAFLGLIQSKVDVKILSLVDITINYLVEVKVKKVGVLATQGTIDSGIYTNKLKNNNIEIVLPSQNMMDHCLMKAIYEYIKKGEELDEAKLLIDRAIGELISNGAEKIIMGCTEIPLIYEMNSILVDPAILISDFIMNIE